LAWPGSTAKSQGKGFGGGVHAALDDGDVREGGAGFVAVEQGLGERALAQALALK